MKQIKISREKKRKQSKQFYYILRKALLKNIEIEIIDVKNLKI